MFQIRILFQTGLQLTSRRQATCYSVSLQHGNRRRLELGYQFMFFAWDGLNCRPGSRSSIKGVPIASRFVSVDTVSIGGPVFQMILTCTSFVLHRSQLRFRLSHPMPQSHG